MGAVPLDFYTAWGNPLAQHFHSHHRKGDYVILLSVLIKAESYFILF